MYLKYLGKNSMFLVVFVWDRLGNIVVPLLMWICICDGGGRGSVGKGRRKSTRIFAGWWVLLQSSFRAVKYEHGDVFYLFDRFGTIWLGVLRGGGK